MNKKLTAVLSECIEDNHKEKLCLIDDIVKIKRTLFGFGYTQHDEFLSAESAGMLFDVLYDMDIEQLEAINIGYELQINEHLSKIK